MNFQFKMNWLISGLILTLYILVNVLLDSGCGITRSLIEGEKTKRSWFSGNGSPAGVTALGLSRLGHFPAYNRACPDGMPRMECLVEISLNLPPEISHSH